MSFPLTPGDGKTAAIPLLLLLLATGLPSIAGAANGFFQHGYGNASKGMAGVGYALPQDSLISATNPAGLSMIADRVDFGIDYIAPRRSAVIDGHRLVTLQSADGHYRGDEVGQFFLPEFGFKRSLPHSLSYGVAVYGNGGMNTDYRDNPYAAFGSTGNAGLDFAQIFVSPALSWQIDDRNALGIAINLVAQHFEAYGLDAFATTQFPGPYSESPSQVTDNGHDRSYGIGYRIGWLTEPVENLTIGLSWQPRTRMSRLDEYRGLLPEQGSLDIPQNFGGGIAWRWRSKLALAFDLQRIRYDEVAALGRPIEAFTNGALLGSDEGPGFGWEAMTVYKLAAAWQFTPRLRIGVGYSKGNQPIPPNQTLFNVLAPAVMERHYTLGFGYQLTPRLMLNGHYGHGPTHVLHGRNSIPDNRLLNPLPPASLGGGEADLQLGGRIFGLALAWAL